MTRTSPIPVSGRVSGSKITPNGAWLGDGVVVTVGVAVTVALGVGDALGDSDGVGLAPPATTDTADGAVTVAKLLPLTSIVLSIAVPTAVPSLIRA